MTFISTRRLDEYHRGAVAPLVSGKADNLLINSATGKLQLRAGTTVLSEVSYSGGGSGDDTAGEVFSVLLDVIFQLQQQNLIDDTELDQVEIIEIDSVSAVTINSGIYANNKVYI